MCKRYPVKMTCDECMRSMDLDGAGYDVEYKFIFCDADQCELTDEPEVEYPNEWLCLLCTNKLARDEWKQLLEEQGDDCNIDVMQVLSEKLHDRDDKVIEWLEDGKEP